jgi:hypothetical protein
MTIRELEKFVDDAKLIGAEEVLPVCLVEVCRRLEWIGKALEKQAAEVEEIARVKAARGAG